MKDYTEDRDLTGIKLLAVDMDLTLLASDGSMPPHMDERIDALAEAGVLFCPASGRPAPTLQMMFPAHKDSIAFCADNGGWVIYQGALPSVTSSDLSSGTRCWTLPPPMATARRCCVPSSRPTCSSATAATTGPSTKYYKDIATWRASTKWTPRRTRSRSSSPTTTPSRAFASTYEPRFKRLYITNAGREWIDFAEPGREQGLRRGASAASWALALRTPPPGDTYNDIPMLSAVVRSLWWPTPRSTCTPADYLVPSNDDRGVATLIDAILAAKER